MKTQRKPCNLQMWLIDMHNAKRARLASFCEKLLRFCNRQFQISVPKIAENRIQKLVAQFSAEPNHSKRTAAIPKCDWLARATPDVRHLRKFHENFCDFDRQKLKIRCQKCEEYVLKMIWHIFKSVMPDCEDAYNSIVWLAGTRDAERARLSNFSRKFAAISMPKNRKVRRCELKIWL